MSRRWWAILAVATALVAGGAARLWLAAAFYGNYDQRSYEIVVAIMRRGGNVYAETSRYNYSPVWMHLLLMLDRAAIALGIPFPTAVRGFLALVDLGNALLLWAVAARFGRARAWLAPVAYLLNPVAAIVVGFHGQFETLALTPVLLMAWVMGRPARRALVLLWVLGTIAVLIKQSIVCEVWALYVLAAPTMRRALAMGALSCLAWLASFIPSLGGGGLVGILVNVILYRGFAVPYGPRLVLPALPALALFGAVMLGLPVLARSWRDMDAPALLRLTAVAFMAASFSMSGQLFVVALLLGAIAPGRWYALLTLAALLAYRELLAASPALPMPALWSLPWLAATVWLVVLVRPHAAARARARALPSRKALTAR